jgi:hypothetical protein
MRSLLWACVLITSLSFCWSQAPSETTGFPVALTDSKTGRTNYARAIKLTRGQLVLAAGNGTIAIPANTISAAEFDLPMPIKQASEAYRAGNVEEAIALYSSLDSMRSLAGLPKCNLAEEFLNFADSYRQLRKYAEAESLLNSVDFEENNEAPLRARLIRAFTFCDRNEIDKAETLMKDFPRMSPDDLNFPLDRIVRTRILLAKGKYHEAALEAGEAVAMTRIEAPIYPESLYLAAACYQKMGEVVEKRNAGGERTDSERIIDESIDYAAVSEAVRQELSLLFSKNYWAKKEPANVDQLLAAAASITLRTEKTPPGETVEATPPADGESSEKKEEKPAWEAFLNKPETKSENEEIDSEL